MTNHPAAPLVLDDTPRHCILLLGIQQQVYVVVVAFSKFFVTCSYMAFFTLQPPESRRAFFERITVAANVVQTHAATLYPFAWDPTASVVVVVVASSKFV